MNCPHCKSCGRTFRENPGTNAYSEERKEEILRAYHERTSLRGLTRILGVSRQTVTSWLKKVANLPPLEETLLPFEEGDCLELDELWSFVFKRRNKRWVWLAQSRRTRQIVAYAIGCRGENTCRRLWNRIPSSYKGAYCFSDLWAAYALVFPKYQLLQSPQRGSTNHIERFNGTIRQRIGRLTRKSLSFSKIDYMHEADLKLFLHSYNSQHNPN